jgi:hypothetical protein
MDVHTERLGALQERMRALDIDALVVAPGLTPELLRAELPER